MNQPKRSYEQSELDQLADYLMANKETILVAWQNMVKEMEDSQVSTLASMSRNKFFDNIPTFLNHLCENLKDQEKYLEEPARAHGAQRWGHGLNLREMVSEWSLLHEVLSDCIDESPELITISPQSVAEAQKRLTYHIHQGIRVSIEEFYRLHRMEEENKLQDLESAVREQGNLKKKRTQSLKEASHDLKGSMTAIQINLFLLQKMELNDEAQKLVQKTSLAADSITQLLKNLLDLSRLEAGREKREIMEFDAADLFRSLCKSMQSLSDAKNIDLRYSGDSSLRVRGDHLKVQRIAQNLLLNSLKYTEKGYVELTWNSITDNSDQWELCVRDTGPGFDFTQTSLSPDESNEANSAGEEYSVGASDVQIQSEGIGLLIVRQLCELLDAILEVESEENAGTTICVTFPVDYPGE